MKNKIIKYTDLDFSRQKYILGLQFAVLITVKALSKLVINVSENELAEEINRITDDYVNNLKIPEIHEQVKEIDERHDK